MVINTSVEKLSGFVVGGFILQSKTFIHSTYERMKDANIVRSTEQFSTDFLGKSKSYFRAIKAQGLEANNNLLTHLANELNTRRELFEKVGGAEISFYYDRWRAIEKDIAEELVLRATDRGCINKYALNSVLNAVQTLIKERAH